jgi:hypothetical protein
MKKTYFILLLGIASVKGYSQTTTSTATPVVAPTAPTVQAKEWDVSLYGFIRTDYIWDTRKSAQVREDNLNLYPLDVVLDANGKDINAVGQSNFLSITSRLGVKVKGPDVWGAKMSGTLEGDFFGNSETATTSTIGLFRLRHAYVSMDWSKTSLTMGQTWYPTFIPEVFPGVSDFNTGIMFNVFGWATQVKLKQNITKELSATFTAFKEREFTALGTTGTQNSASINSALPSLNAQLQYKGKNVFLGAGLEYKSMQPLTVSATNLVTTEKVTSSSVFGYAKYSNDKVIIKAYGISGGNMNNLVMLGGFTGTTASGIQSYDPTKTTSFWFDIASNGKSIAPGFFIGTTKNNGASTAATALNSIYMRGLTGSRVVDNVWRMSGRIDFKKNKFRVSPELEYTAATWGDADLYGKATTNKKDVGNLRTMVSCVYLF